MHDLTRVKWKDLPLADTCLCSESGIHYVATSTESGTTRFFFITWKCFGMFCFSFFCSMSQGGLGNKLL